MSCFPRPLTAPLMGRRACITAALLLALVACTSVPVDPPPWPEGWPTGNAPVTGEQTVWVLQQFQGASTAAPAPPTDVEEVRRLATGAVADSTAPFTGGDPHLHRVSAEEVRWIGRNLAVALVKVAWGTGGRKDSHGYAIFSHRFMDYVVLLQRSSTGWQVVRPYFVRGGGVTS